MSSAPDDQDPTTAAESYGDYSVDDEDQPVGNDNLVTHEGGDLPDEMDRGYNPPEKWSAGQGYGNTPYEEAVGEDFEQRLAQEVPDPTAKPIEELVEDAEKYDEDLTDHEVGDERAGRLVAPDEGAHTDTEKDLIASDVGIDGAAASAEEAAVHVIADDDPMVDDTVPDDAIIEELLHGGTDNATQTGPGNENTF
ncbi:MAG: hypothetical protein JWN84_1468 [Nocardioides sp.]|nr:hypothetical protein [Nocardioides sp.]